MLHTTIVRVLTGAAVALGLTGAAFSAELRYAHVGAEGDIQTIYAAEAAKGIAAATNNEVTVTVYPASQLGGVICRALLFGLGVIVAAVENDAGKVQRTAVLGVKLVDDGVVLAEAA